MMKTVHRETREEAGRSGTRPMAAETRAKAVKMMDSVLDIFRAKPIGSID